MEGLAPAGAVLHAIGVPAGAADAEQGLVLEVAPQLRNEIFIELKEVAMITILE